jgi:alkanesulfonate monooxygenase SsuD/methylene tetrahydromethanopterin reductase-like flavin-dependent oxidoreductase (luciferase family)
MIIGVGLDPSLGVSFTQLRELGHEAARLGFESAWTVSGRIPDSFHVCAGWSEATSRDAGTAMKTGIAVVPAPRMWNPLSLAAQAATVSMIGDGGFTLGIGTGGFGTQHWSSWGLPNRPIAVMRDYLTILRGLLRGEVVTHHGEALDVSGVTIGGGFSVVPVYLAAIGPMMVRLAGACADGTCLNWATPEQIAWSRERVAEGAAHAGRSPEEIALCMSIRVCVDDDVEAARRALATEILRYSLARPGADPLLGYRGHFGRMGFDAALSELEARRERGASMDALADAAPDELLRAFGYFGPAKEAPMAFRALAAGLDEAIVRVITVRPGVEPVIEAMEALTPAIIRAV